MWLQLFVGAILAVAALVRFFLSYRQDTRKDVRSDGKPYNPVALLGLGLVRSFAKLSGRLSGPVSGARLTWEVDALRPEMLSLYERATMFKGGLAEGRFDSKKVFTELSVCYPQALSVRLVPSLFVDRGFPLSPLGILHMKQSIVQHAPLAASGDYSLEVFFARYPTGLMYAETDKGIELNVRVLLRARKSKEIVWQGDTEVVSRAKQSGRRGPPKVFSSPKWDAQSIHAVAESTGRSYAAASGDYNPHHLYWFTAMPVGFSRPIAHGMWTLSAAMHEMEAAGVIRKGVYPISVTCEFKKPLLMPASVTFGYRHSVEKKATIDFGVYDKNNVNPHVIGSVEQ